MKLSDAAGKLYSGTLTAMIEEVEMEKDISGFQRLLDSVGVTDALPIIEYIEPQNQPVNIKITANGLTGATPEEDERIGSIISKLLKRDAEKETAGYFHSGGLVIAPGATVATGTIKQDLGAATRKNREHESSDSLLAGLAPETNLYVDPELAQRLRDTINTYHREITEEHSVTEEAKDPQIEAMKEVAQLLTDNWTASQPTFALKGPMSLTILKDDHTYSKQSHVGLEEFKGVRAYVGKRGAIICVFAPVAVERYHQMELPYNDCLNALSEFRDNVQDAGAVGKLAVISESKKKIAQAIEIEQKSKVYSDFGDF